MRFAVQPGLYDHLKLKEAQDTHCAATYLVFAVVGVASLVTIYNIGEWAGTLSGFFLTCKDCGPYTADGSWDSMHPAPRDSDPSFHTP